MENLKSFFERKKLKPFLVGDLLILPAQTPFCADRIAPHVFYARPTVISTGAFTSIHKVDDYEYTGHLILCPRCASIEAADHGGGAIYCLYCDLDFDRASGNDRMVGVNFRKGNFEFDNDAVFSDWVKQ